MKKNKNIEVIDFGSYTLPRGWDELTLGQYQEIERYYSDKDKKFDVREVLDLLCDHSVEEISQLPIDFVDKLLNELIWLQENPEWGEPTNRIELNGETYIINIMEKMKFGEFVSAEGILKNDPHNYAAILAIICRKEGEIYDSKFEAEVFDERVKMWESQPITKIMPLIAFFLNLYVVLETPSKLYSMAEETLNHIAQSINNSEQIGASKKLYLKWQVTRLRKSLESSRNISQTHSHSLPTSLKKVKWKRKKINTSK